MVFSLRKLNCFNIYIKNASYIINLNENTNIIAPLFEYYAHCEMRIANFTITALFTPWAVLFSLFSD